MVLSVKQHIFKAMTYPLAGGEGGVFPATFHNHKIYSQVNSKLEVNLGPGETNKRYLIIFKMHTIGYNRNWVKVSSPWFPDSARRHPEHCKQTHPGRRELAFEGNRVVFNICQTLYKLPAKRSSVSTLDCAHSFQQHTSVKLGFLG